MAVELPLTISDSATGATRDVLVSFTDGHTLGELRDVIGATAQGGDGAGRAQPLSALALVAGDRLDLADAAATHAAPPEAQLLGQWVVAVVGGPVAGRSIPLAATPMTIGRDKGCTVVVPDAEASRVHASLSVGQAGVVLEDLNSANGTLVDGKPIGAPTTLEPGALFCVGNSVLTVRRIDESPASLEHMPDGRLRFNRPPRAKVAADARTFSFPSAPAPARRQGINIAAVAAPVVVGIAVALITGQLAYLLFVLASPLVAVANMWSTRRNAQRNQEEEVEAFESKTKAIEADLSAAIRRDEQVRRWSSPDPAATMTIAVARTQRLWERRPGDDDFADLRVGTVDLPANLTVHRDGPAPTAPPKAALVPACVPLARAGVVGLAGPRPALNALVRAALVNIATLHAPDELSLVIVGDADPGEWEWAKWLPHLRPSRGEACRRVVGFDAGQRRRRLSELTEIVASRQAQLAAAPGRNVPRWPTVVVVLDGTRTLRADELVASLLRDGPAVGVYAVCLADDRAGLPAESRASVLFGTSAVGSSALSIAFDREQVIDVIPDGLSVEEAERAARRLAPLYSVSASAGQRGRVPDPPVDELELLMLDPPTAPAVTARWQHATSRPKAMLGLSAEGVLEFDIARDGPHALMAGTTGAGKSELLQTMVASLAADAPPNALTFLLVDFKGGSAFRECERLPHTVGVISNLDGRLVERALDSVQAELRWRQARFAEAAVKDFDEYRATVAARPHLTAIPRLLIVVDELKELVDAYPAAVPRLSQTARLGRSLGVHLVLATQKPGSVPGLGDLRANTDLRVCLRVQEASESQDVIGSAEAAAIPKSMVGRAFARFGDGRLVLFQAGYLGAPLGGETAAPAVQADAFDLVALGDEPRRVAAAPTSGDARTNLSALVDVIGEAAGQLGLPDPRLPWLPPLERAISVEDPRLTPPYVGENWAPVFPFALVDVPAEQRQDQLALDLDRVGNLLVVGPGRSGRTSVLRTLAGAIARSSAPTDVHLYAVECRGRSLADLERLPHCGGVISTDDTERLERLFGYLSAEIERRDALIAGVSGLGEYRHDRRPQSDSLPYIAVLVDNYEAFHERFSYEDSGRLADLLGSLVSEGPARGIHFVLTTDRRGALNKVAGGITERLFLRPVDRDDQALLGLPVGSVDANMGPGRGYWSAGPVEAQVALLRRGGETEAEAVGRIGDDARTRPPRLGPEGGPGIAPRRVPPLPRSVDESQAAARRAAAPLARPGVVTPAVGGLEVEPIDIDLTSNGSTFVVAGPRGSGRSTALAAVLRSLSAGSDPRQVLVVAPRRSPLRAYAPTLPFGGGVQVFASSDSFASDVPAAVEAAEGRVTLVIDDAELLLDDPVSGRLDRIVRGAADRDGFVVLGGTTTDLGRRFSGWIFDARQSRTGVLLQPSGPADGDVFDVRLPRSVGSGQQPPPGRGLVIVRGRWVPAQVILPAGLAVAAAPGS